MSPDRNLRGAQDTTGSDTGTGAVGADRAQGAGTDTVTSRAAARADGAASTAPRGKTLTTWAAVLGGFFGLHRFYLRGMTDPWGWLHAVAAFIGLLGVQRIRTLGVDDAAATYMMPFLGLSIAAAMLAAIVAGLTPDERWAERHHPELGLQPTAWAPVLGVILALMLGATALMATVAFVGQRFFEAMLGA